MLPKLQCLDFFAVTLLVVALVQWLATTKLYRHLPLELIWQMVRLACRTTTVFLLIAGLFGVLGAIGSVFLPLPFISQLGLGLFAITSVCLPPSVLLLGATRVQNAHLYKEIIWRTTPLRAIHMLADFKFGAIYGDPLHPFNYRALADASWQAVVHQFMEIVPIVIIDTRTVTPSVVYETRRMLSPGLRNKAIFIVGANGKSPVLMWARLGMAEPLPPICTVTHDQVIPLLRNLYRTVLGH